tara:strand:+ start:104 stop:982 length:879 start_codon:yes stop_codon:yes gene_type:complete
MAIANAGTSVSNSFVTMFSDDVKQAYQQSSSNLVDAVRVVRNVTGSTYKFHKLSKGGSVKNKDRFADVIAMSDTSKSLGSGSYAGSTAQNSVVTATLNNYHSGEYIDELDQFKTNVDLRGTFASAIASGLNRAIDQEIVDALDAASPTTDIAAGSGLTKAKFLEVHEAMNDLNIPTSDRCIIISPQALTDLLSDTNLVTAADGLVSNTALTSGYIPNVFGFRVIMSTLLTKNSVVRDCYAIHKDAVGLALAQDITARIDYVPSKASHLVLGTMSGGSTVIDSDGVVNIQVTE